MWRECERNELTRDFTDETCTAAFLWYVFLDVRDTSATRRDVSLKRSWRFNDGVSYNLIDTRVTSRDVYDACDTTW